MKSTERIVLEKVEELGPISTKNIVSVCECLLPAARRVRFYLKRKPEHLQIDDVTVQAEEGARLLIQCTLGMLNRDKRIKRSKDTSRQTGSMWEFVSYKTSVRRPKKKGTK